MEWRLRDLVLCVGLGTVAMRATRASSARHGVSSLLLRLLLLLLLPPPSSQGHSGPIVCAQLSCARASADPVDVPTARSPAPSLLLILSCCSYLLCLCMPRPPRIQSYWPNHSNPRVSNCVWRACPPAVESSATKKKRWRAVSCERDSAACSAVPFRDPTWPCTCHRCGGGASPPRGTCHP